MAWDLLMDPSYQTLVSTICSNHDELKRFRQLLVQTVMATDIADAELRAARNCRWDKAFANESADEEKKDGEDESDHDAGMDDSGRSLSGPKHDQNPEESEDDKNRKATIILEHLMQARYDVGMFIYGGWPWRHQLTDFLSIPTATLHTPCSTGTCTDVGIAVSCKKCTWPTSRVAWVRIRPSFGTPARLVSLIIMSFLWPRNSRTVMSLAFLVTNA